jgi:Zn-finger protein
MKFDIRWVDDQLLSCTACTFDACHFVSLDVTSYCPRKPITRHTSLGELHENDQQETWHVPTTNRPEAGRDFG